MWVTVVSFIIVSEMLIHITAFTAFINFAIDAGDVTEPFLHLLPIVITFGTFLIFKLLEY